MRNLCKHSRGWIRKPAKTSIATKSQIKRTHSSISGYSPAKTWQIPHASGRKIVEKCKYFPIYFPGAGLIGRKLLIIVTRARRDWYVTWQWALLFFFPPMWQPPLWRRIKDKRMELVWRAGWEIERDRGCFPTGIPELLHHYFKT